MIYKNTRRIMYIIETILIFLSHTFAPWNSTTYKQAEASTSLTCREWMGYYGFSRLDVERNRLMARDRNRNLDREVCIWPVLYAHVLVAFPTVGHDMNNLTPTSFCFKFFGHNFEKLFYEKFSEVERTCKGWISLYGYSPEPSINQIAINKALAMFRDRDEDGEISLWAAGYAWYLTRDPFTVPISVDAYCEGIEVIDEARTFMNFNETIMTCEQWIKLCGYTDDINENAIKAQKHNPSFSIFINHWTRIYTIHLNQIFSDDPLNSNDSRPMTPRDFCESRGYLDLQQVLYFDIYD